ncbi:hypothetical protein Skr01_53740 [Sphaerisporangium krabiense]|uniref:Uncharacterized protein n=1 Tax=Sphaerisporangium krabiense TaxID=763782 RepID=A0A7W8Z4A2_9ACTN|nr:hypothetical protein [Sphaerisporangium krabiense]MBB5627131.1 hypothetical protein [Sphaerisporangium krabiense]GII65289.1 hypothetical protein Skr01_53740 [Sphaerisporangium krabiense]
MNKIVDFFVTTRPNAAGVLGSGPRRSFPTASSCGFDAEEALLDWESHLTGRSFDDLADDDLPEIVADGENDAVILALSDALVSALGAASNPRMDELAQWWAEEKARDGLALDPFTALDILRRVTDLIRQKRSPGESVYCWTC